MPSERVQRQIDRLLDEAEAAMGRLDWAVVRARSEAVLALDLENSDARTYLRAAQSKIHETELSVGGPPPVDSSPAGAAEAQRVPTSFADGRYGVRRFLGEGGKKKVYLAHDARLDRDVAFSLIKTEGLDDVGIARILQEAQAMVASAVTPTSSRCTTLATKTVSRS